MRVALLVLAAVAPIPEIVELERAIQRAPRPVQLAALADAPEAADGWTLLPAVVARLDDADRGVAAAAARSAARLARRIAPDVGSLGVPADELAGSASRCARVARASERRADQRVHALECAVALGDDGSAQALLVDADPEVRLAAVQLVDAAVAKAELLAIIDGDEEPRVVLAAAAAACRVTKLPAASRTRVARLQKDPRVDRGDALGFARCR